MDVTITVDGKKLYVESPYNSEFPASARKLGGKWANGKWAFPAHAEAKVRELCREKYGTDGTAAPALVTVLITLGEGSSGGWPRSTDLALAGIPIARVRGRDSGATMADGVSVMSGRITSGGSMKNPMIRWDGGTQVQMEIPESLIERVKADRDVQGVEVVSSDEDRKAELRAEAEGLRARLEQIEAELAELERGAS